MKDAINTPLNISPYRFPLIYTGDRYRAGVGCFNTAIIHDSTIEGFPCFESVVWRGKTEWQTCTEAQAEADEKVKEFNSK
jgi:hypothetical protein